MHIIVHCLSNEMNFINVISGMILFYIRTSFPG